MRSSRRLGILSLTFLVGLAALSFVKGSCEGNSCAEQTKDAKAAGLLGAAIIQQCSKTKDYPADGTTLKPIEFEAPVVDLRWAGLNHDVDKFVFAITEPTEPIIGGHVWRSDNYGREGSWKDVTMQMEGALSLGQGMNADLAGILDIYFHEDHPERILFAGPAYYHWLTTDYGQTFTKVETPGRTLGFWHEIKIHPGRPEWVLAKVRRNVCEEWDASTNPQCAYDLFLSQTFGHSWTNLTKNSGGAIASFWDFDWGASLHHGEKRAFPDETIFATVYESAEAMKGPYPQWDKDMHFVTSHDFFKSAHNKLVSCGNQFEVIGRKVYLALPSDCPTEPDGSPRTVSTAAGPSSVILYASDNEAKDFEQVCLPVKWLDLAYNLVKNHDGSTAFLVVDHDEEDMIAAKAPIGNIYAPGYNNTLYTLSMSANFRRRYITDFGRVEGVPGVYMANQLSLNLLHDSGNFHPVNYEKFIKSKITFNGGGRWEDLAKPEHYRHAVCDRCTAGHDPSKCQLHLHGPSSWHEGPEGRPSFYSHENAPGIVMAVGNTGEFLDFAADAMCTWLSRDGGATWEDVAPHAGIYEYGDHGGLLLMASHETEGPADSLQFSLDQGACWHTIHLSEAIDIQNIRVEPKAASHVFVVHGQACLKTPQHPTCSHTKEGTKPAGKIYVIDLKPIMGADWRDCGEEDYETWSPPKPDMCLLGRNVTMERRRRSSDCFNGKEYERAATTFAPCPCDTADVECEFGFEYVNHECRPIQSVDTSLCAAVTSGRYHASQTKHRLVSDDVCADVSRVISDTDGKGNLPGGPGAGHKHRGQAARAFVVFLVLGIVGTAGALWWFVWASDNQKAAVEETLSPVVGTVKSAWNWLLDALIGLKDRITGGGSSYRNMDDGTDAYFQPLASGDFGLDEEEARSPASLNGH